MKTALTRRDLYQVLSSEETDHDLRKALQEMAMKAGRPEDEAAILADRVMETVSLYEATKSQADESTAKALEPLFRCLKHLEPEDQVTWLSQLSFGLRCASEDELFQELLAQKTKDDQSAFANAHARDGETPESLKQELLDQAQHMNLSPKAIRRMARGLNRAERPVEAAGLLGRSNYALKCAVSLSSYLATTDPELTLTQAVLSACTSEDFQAVGDAVHRGLVTKKAAVGLLNGILFAGGVTLALSMIPLAGAAGFIPAILIVLGTVGIADILSNETKAVAESMGGIAVTLPDQVKAGLDAVADYLSKTFHAKEASTEEAADAEVEVVEDGAADIADNQALDEALDDGLGDNLNEDEDPDSDLVPDPA